MQAVVGEHVPVGIDDGTAHCLAGALIAKYCSVTEAQFAVAGKELLDLVGSGDADADDWRAGRRGIDCARAARDDESLADESIVACCR